MRADYKKLFLTFLLTAVISVAATAFAAQITSQTRKGYERLSFVFDQPAHLSVTNRGNTIVLQFDKPLGDAQDSLKTRLAGYADSVTLSPDGKQATLVMKKTYRTRQFVSGNSIGLDIIGEAPTEVAAPAPPPVVVADAGANAAPEPKKIEYKPEQKPAPIKQVEKKEPATPREKPVKAEKAAPLPEVEAVVVPPVDPILTTKPITPAPAPAVSPPANAVVAEAENPPSAAVAEPIMTTKKVEEVAAVAEPAKKVEPKPEPEKPAAETPAKVSAPAESPKQSLPFMVTAQTTDTTTTLNFPWPSRTAAAVYERARDVWLVFSQPADANVKLLRTLLPKEVIDVVQYRYPHTTIVRLTTDGSVHAAAALAKGGYGWNVTLSGATPKASLDIPMESHGSGDSRILQLAAFDTADTVQFYDPRLGDWMVVIPTFEEGRGVSHERNFPGINVLKTGQGIALATARDDIRTERSRAGVSLSAPGGLAISENLPVLSPEAAPLPGASAASDVMLPYDQWFIPTDKFKDTLQMRLRAVSNASKDARPDALLSLATLFLGQGMASEAHGYLSNIQREYPDYFAAKKLALLDAASNVMLERYDDARANLASPELVNLKEADVWREVVGLFAPKASTVQLVQEHMETLAIPVAPAPSPTPSKDEDLESADVDKTVAQAPTATTKPAFRFLKYNKPYIRFYPPKIRQKLAMIAANAYIENDQPEKALAAFDTLNRDGVLKPIKLEAEYTLGVVAEKKDQTAQALEIFERLSKQSEDPHVAAKSRFALAMLQFKKGHATAEQTVDLLETMRLSWRGDALEHDILTTLVGMYTDLKRFDDVLRTYRSLLDAFPNDPETLARTNEMNTLFQNLFIDGLADEMPPLKSLSLFYEFRDLTPIGPQGDSIIQHLADRLAAFDLLDRATQLLEHQIKFRVSGEERSRIGARLALLHLLNHHPQEALDVLQITSFGANPAPLQQQRLQLTAQALNSLGKHDEALSILFRDTSKTGAYLRLDVLWSMSDWPNVVNRAEDILADRPSLTAPLSSQETETLLKLALAYTFEGDYTQLRYLRDYYTGLIPDTAYKEIFTFITNDTAPLDPEDFALLAQQISHTESFLGTFKAKIADGKLSEAVK